MPGKGTAIASFSSKVGQPGAETGGVRMQNGEQGGYSPQAVWLYSDGMYHWIYERNLYTSRFETNYVVKIMALVFSLSWLVMAVTMLAVGAGGGNVWMGFGIVTAVCLGGGLLTVGILRVASLATAKSRGGVEVIGFTMNDDGLRQFHYEGVRTAEEVAERMMLAAGNARAEDVMQPGGFGVTLFRDVRRMDLHPGQDLIDLTLKGNYKCRVYVRKEDFDFVRDFIGAHIGK